MDKIKLLLVSFLMLSGCMVEREYPDEIGQQLARGYYDYGFNANSGDYYLDIVDTSLSGIIGEVSSSPDSPSFVKGFDEGEYTEVEVNAVSEDGTTMSILTFVNGGITSEELSIGRALQFTGATTGVSTASGDFHIGAVLCSGPIPGEWNYDDIGSRVEIEVTESEEVPDAKRIKFDITTSAGDTGVGHIDVIVEDLEGEYYE